MKKINQMSHSEALAAAVEQGCSCASPELVLVLVQSFCCRRMA